MAFNDAEANHCVILFRAAVVSLITNVPLPTGSVPLGACSDGFNFWVTLLGSKEVLRIRRGTANIPVALEVRSV